MTWGFSGFELRPLIPERSDSSMLPKCLSFSQKVPVHKESSRKTWFEVFGVEGLQLTASTPDPNPTEHFCDNLSC